MPALSLEHISKTYAPSPPSLKDRLLRVPGKPGHQALDDVSFTVDHGEFFGLLGPNGAGKTTLISILAGLVSASAGTARVCGHDVQGDFRQARRSLGVVPQEIVYDPFFTVRETLRIQSGYFGLRNNDDWIDEILLNLGLSDKSDANMRALSGGMKRRVLVAQALVHRPPVIILDEPTAGVDVDLRRTLWDFISRLNKEGHTILLTTHYLEEAEALCGRIAMLKGGRIAALDTMQALLARVGGSDLEDAFVRIMHAGDNEGTGERDGAETLEIPTL
ncbi:ABC transporter ATP-binding protein [Allopusillimonas ginsengisoli]|uniref:ABC transporter ATP-binding protein n=1 Tax=Allopusillimonas ginsengisoli TaxID=453575 RepID=UPI0010225B92|nr:ABC transporter ATP-binding protein [Allopusillimonas ginsengisoli]TEA77918.1 ABC transporter ATP-binding protein [Allopusillimonas ginsengisoli]